MATVVTDQNFDEEVLKAGVPVLVDFYADWCGPCQMIMPMIEELAGDYEGKAKVVKLDVDASQETAQKFGVMSIPTFIIFKGGEAVANFVGAKSKEDVKKELDAVS